jgi:hypothetical protein
MFTLKLTPNAQATLDTLEKDPAYGKVFKAVDKALDLMEVNLRHPSLNTHEYYNLIGKFLIGASHRKTT